MKTIFIIVALTCIATSLFPQDPTVKVEFDGEERFRFEGDRLEVVNPLRNVLIGDSCGFNMNGNPDAVFNVFIGKRAGFSNTSGRDNIFIGDSAGYSNNDGNYNTVIGAWAGWSATSALQNSFYGVVSGAAVTTGHRNSYYGAFTGYYNDTGYYNSFVGHAAGSQSKGSCNTFLGKSAGVFNKGDSSVLIGFRSGMNDTTSNKLYISNSETDHPLVYGEFDNRLLRFNANRLEMHNGLENTILGDSAGMNITGSRNVLVGYKAGYMAGNSFDNVIIGDSSGYNITSGASNVFLGTWTGFNTTDGIYNVFIGTGAGFSNENGHLNVIIGGTSGLYNTTGKENVFLGTSAGAYNTTGSCNTYLGRRAGVNGQEGDSSVFIGYYAGANEMNSHRLYIANSNTVTPLIYGEFDNELVRIHGTLDIKGEYQFPASDGSNGQILHTNGTGTLSWGSATGDFANDGEVIGRNRTLGNMDAYSLGIITSNIPRLHITSDGKIGIGTGSPDKKLHIKAAAAEDGLVLERAAAGQNTRIQFQNEGGVNQSALVYEGLTDDISFEVQGTSNVLYLKNNGTVGIGTGDPHGDLQIGNYLVLDQTSSSSDYLIGNNLYYNGNWRYTHNGAAGYITISNVGAFTVGNCSYGIEDAVASLQHRLHISSDGLVGIGTTDPNANLDVFGTVKVGTGIPSNQLGVLTIAATDTGTPANIRFTHGTSGYIGMGSNTNQDFEINKNANLGPDSETLFLINRSTGKVCIGSTGPTAKLDINHSTGYDQLRMRTSYTPSGSSDSNGNTGDIAWDNDFIYIKTSAGWKRAALSTF